MWGTIKRVGGLKNTSGFRRKKPLKKDLTLHGFTKKSSRF